MTIEKTLRERANNVCELCAADSPLSVYEVPESQDVSVETSVYICQTCNSQITNLESMDTNHWRCLNNSMWSECSAVQVMAYRILNSLRSEGWAADLQDQMYLEGDALNWAKAGIHQELAAGVTVTKDSNGVQLVAGDSVTLIKDLVVKGAGFTAKRGALVKNISLTDDPKHIEGKVSGTQIVLVTAFLKKV
jgi:protein PhnA